MSHDVAQLPSFPMQRRCPMDPPPEYNELQRKDGPQRVRMWNGTTVWLYTRYDDVRALLSDTRLSVDPRNPGFPSFSAARDAVLAQDKTFIRMDEPDHNHYRRMLTKEFMVSRIESYRPMIQRILDKLIDDMVARGNSGDFVEMLATPLPSLVICELLGIPYADHDFFEEQSRKKVLVNGDPQVPIEASRKLIEYIDRHLTNVEKNPGNGDNIVSRLVLEQVLPGKLSHSDAVTLVDLMLMAGHETTANMIALGTLSLLTNPGELEKLRAGPSLVRNAVEEMLRYHSIVHYNGARVALEDVEIGGQLIRKGEGAIGMANAANRDPSQFECPHQFDITRKATHHVAFSFGIHQCLGQPLARAELQAVFSTLFKRLPDLKLDVPVEDLPFKSELFVYGVHSLPVSW